jgi:glutamate--cysteine ligase catalytic subunit
MTEGAGRIADFSKVYRMRAHERERIGMTPNSIPRLEEVDDMLKQSEKIQMSLQRMREVVFNHHQASMMEPPRDSSHYRPVNGYEPDGPTSFQDEHKTNAFGGIESLKRPPKRGVSRLCPHVISN